MSNITSNLNPNATNGYRLTDSYELSPTARQNQKSFYRKAHVYKAVDDNGMVATTLKSYDTDVMTIYEDRNRSVSFVHLYLSPYSDLFSATTRKHIKAFADLTGPEYRELWDSADIKDGYRSLPYSDLVDMRRKGK